MQGQRIAVIGAGSMGRALVRGILNANWAAPENIVATTRREETAAELADRLLIETTNDNAAAAKGADIVILAVKPQIIDAVMDEIAASLADETTVISIAAGVSTARIERHLSGSHVVRAMPNLAVHVDEGATAYCLGEHATAADGARAQAIFEAVGMAVKVDEYHMDAITGLSGTGPMYVFQFLEGLSDAGVKVGLSRDIAQALTYQTVLGAAKMAMASDDHPARLKDRVTSPGGTAITALHTMERGGLRAILIDAVEAATKRSAELGDDE